MQLAPEHIAALDSLSEPTLNFPAAMLRNSPNTAHAGATVNGEPTAARALAPTNDADRY